GSERRSRRSSLPRGDSLPPRRLRRGPQPRGKLVAELSLLEAPAPVALLAARDVHPGLAAEAEHVLRRDDREARGRRPGELEQAPGGIRGIEARPRAVLRRERVPPAARGVVVVRARIDDAVLAVRLRAVRVVRV